MIYVLRDSVYDQYISKGDWFNFQWMSLIQREKEVKIAPVGMEDFVLGDTVVIYLDNDNPYGTYKLPSFLKKIFIVGRIGKGNWKFLQDADYIIYMNRVQKSIGDMVGIDKPNLVLPRHPMPYGFDVELVKKDRIFIGGLFTVDKIDGFFEKLLLLNKEYPTDTQFFIMGAGNGTQYTRYCDQLSEWLHKSPINGNRIVRLELKLFYQKIYQLHIAASKHVYLWREEPTIDQVLDMIERKDMKVLDHYIAESSTLAVAQYSKCEIIADNRISYLPFFDEEQSNYDFRDLMCDITKILSSIS